MRYLMPFKYRGKHFIIFKYIWIIDNRDKKENSMIAFIIEFWQFFKREYFFGTPGEPLHESLSEPLLPI